MEQVECMNCTSGGLEIVAKGTLRVVFKCKCGAYTVVNLNEEE